MRLRTLSRLLIGAVILIFVGIAAYVATTPQSVPAWSGDTDALRGTKAPNFALRDQNGRLISLNGMHGKAVILTFFYTHCPDTCPLTAQKIRTILHRFGPEARKISVLIVSTDPLHDNRQNAKVFLHKNGSPSWHFLLGTYSQLKPVYREYYEDVRPPALSKRIGEEHGPWMYLIDAHGREQALLEDSQPEPNIAQDLHILLRDHHWLSQLPAAPRKGARTPNIALPSLSGGRELRVSRFRGKPLLINFWGTYCAPCTKEMPLLEKTYLHYRGRVQILGVDNQEPAKEVRAFVKQVHVTYPIALDSQGNSAYTYQIRGTPTTFFVNAQGVIESTWAGELNPSILRSKVDQLLKAA